MKYVLHTNNPCGGSITVPVLNKDGLISEDEIASALKSTPGPSDCNTAFSFWLGAEALELDIPESQKIPRLTGMMFEEQLSRLHVDEPTAVELCFLRTASGRIIDAINDMPNITQNRLTTFWLGNLADPDRDFTY